MANKISSFFSFPKKLCCLTHQFFFLIMSPILLPTKKFENFLSRISLRKETHTRQSNVGISVELICERGGRRYTYLNIWLSQHPWLAACLLKPFMMFPRYGFSNIRRQQRTILYKVSKKHISLEERLLLNQHNGRSSHLSRP